MRRARVTGFTLVEVLVALALLALLGVMTWRGLDRVIAQRTRVAADTQETERIVRTLAQIERDFAYRVPDALFTGRYGGGGALPLALELGLDASGNQTVQVLRARSDAPGTWRVAYDVEADRLMRRVSDAAKGGSVDSVVMLEAVHGLQVRLLLPSGWVEPRALLGGAAVGRVAALELAIERGGGERYVEVLAL